VTHRTVVIVHREIMVAQGLAAALSRYPGILPVAVATTAAEGERCAEHADAVALDASLDGTGEAARTLRRRGKRVIFIGATGDEDSGATVSTSEPVSALATALVPGTIAKRRALSSLTPREQEVLSLVMNGLAAKQVARHLGISPKTVEQHKSRIFAKLSVRNQTAAASLALSAGLSGAEPWMAWST
jgi:DNA-binding NarL/FixJ family response regulator